MKKILSVSMILVLMMTLTAGTAFAAEGTMAGKTTEGNTVPVHLTAPAISDGAGIDFTITDKITMGAAADSTVLTITDLVITNNAKVGQLKVDSIEAAAATGWTIVADDADYFVKNKVDKKEFSLVCGSNDFAETAKVTYGETKLLAANGGTQTFEFDGHIGTFSTAVSDTKVAEIIATVSLY